MKVPRHRRAASFERASFRDNVEEIFQGSASPPKKHVSRSWFYIGEPSGPCYQVILEAPFVRMKEIQIETEFDEDFRMAESKKEEANALYKQRKYHEALALYNEAIELCPNLPAYYGNRAACQMMLGRYRPALEDVQQALRMDDQLVKVYLREAKCHIALGDTVSASRSLQRAKELDPHNSLLPAELKALETLQYFLKEGEKAYDKMDYRKVVFCMDRALHQSVACTKFKLTKAECLAYLGRYQEAQEIANDVLHLDSMNVDALYVRGMCLYYHDNIDKAFSHFQQLLRLAPDHSKGKEIYRRSKLLKSKKEAGNAAFKSGRLQEAYDMYTSALEIDPKNVFTNAKLYFNRATVCSKIDKLNQAVEDCSKALQLDENYIKAYLRRGKCYIDLEMYEEAVKDYEVAYRKEKSKDNKRYLEHAKLELKKSRRKDYYKILGVHKDASEDDIKKAYRKRALIHHPDRHSNATDDIKREQEKKFKEIGEAYNILCDPKKRTRYDNGLDLEEEEGFADVDPNHVFQAFFGSGGFGFTSTGHQGFGQSFSFPNGFSFQFG